MMIDQVEILGLVAGFLTAFSSLPQSIKIIKLKESNSVSTLTYAMLTSSYVLWLTYGVILGLISIIIWNTIALVLGGSILALKIFVWPGNKQAAPPLAKAPPKPAASREQKKAA
jgi:MtN3 and saliva related transmembrane protein